MESKIEHGNEIIRTVAIMLSIEIGYVLKVSSSFPNTQSEISLYYSFIPVFLYVLLLKEWLRHTKSHEKLCHRRCEA